MGNEMFIGTSVLKRPEGYTYKDYKQWPDDERWELIRGEAWAMSPAPKRRHQTLLGSLYAQLDRFFSGKSCRPHIAPVDVFLLLEDDNLDNGKNVVQPDAFVVCDPGKLNDTGVIGAPDFVLEILSPATAMKDQSGKKLLYESSGVREYWILNPETLEVFMYVLNNRGTFDLPKVADLRKPVALEIFEGLELSIRPEDLI